MQDSGQARHPSACDKGKKFIVPDGVDTPANDKLSSGSSPNLSLAKSSRVRSRQRHSHRPAFSNSDNGMFRRARRETCREQNHPNEVPRNVSNAFALHVGVMSPIQPRHPAFGIGPTLYILPTTMIQSLDGMLSSPLGRHILDNEPPRRFVIPAFAMFDGSTDPYDHMLYYSQAMTLNAGNDLLLCKVFLASLRGPVLAWFHKLP